MKHVTKVITLFLCTCRVVGRLEELLASHQFLFLLDCYIVTVGFAMSHSCVHVQGTDWMEPVLLWIAICMPTGSGKSALCKSIVDTARKECKFTDEDPSWCLDDQSFEKLGAIMADNHGKLLGLYDELSMFLSQINVFRSRGLSDSHELAVFLQLYVASSWTRNTGTSILIILIFIVQVYITCIYSS